MFISSPLSLAALLSGSSIAHATGAYQFDPLKHLSGVSPPFDYEEASSPLDPVPPPGCNVTRAAYLVRHAAIHSNSYDYVAFIEPFLEKLSRTTVKWSEIPSLSFLATWKNPILKGEKEKLSRSGQLQAMTFGVEVGHRYFNLRTPQKIWAASSDRTMKSAHFFAKGIALDASKIAIERVYEGKKDGANSLNPYDSCPAFSRVTGSDEASVYRDIYTRPVIQRFNSLAPSFNFTSTDIYAFSLICGYETVLRGSSPFCGLSVLSSNEWLGFEYTNDIKYFYNSGYGLPSAGATGFPWVNASFNALMSPHDTNSNEVKDQDLFVSFTHRGMPPMVLVAMGLFNNSAYSGGNNINDTMPLDTINYQRVWKSSQIIPFMTDIGIEKLECDSFGFDEGTYYRILVNDRPQSLIGCHDGPADSCKEESIRTWLNERAKVVGDFDTMCRVDYANSTNILSIYDS
ncbi:unnamed protein product [Blumeria hordei]|uniref:Acid phosphatase n=2 Tax=Blumeria hordei TaxID=2867405 RepID=A0A383UW51_BLUHO|nr:CELP0015 Effector like protein [Blumeria hordei DH14]SZF03858.1 unnamed protein product [Blumeria hordei]